MNKNYPIPANFGHLITRGEKLAKVDLHTSIRQHIYLILISRFGDFRFDHEYGCSLWELDFDTRAALRTKKQELERTVKSVLEKHEPRLGEIRVKFNITVAEVLVRGFKKLQRSKERLEISVTGTVLETNEPFSPEPFIIFFSPILTGSD